MLRNLYLSISVLFFSIFAAFIMWLGYGYVWDFLYHLPWLILLFGASIIGILIYAVVLINIYLVSGSRDTYLGIWINIKRFIQSITWDKLYKFSKKAILVILAILFLTGCWVAYIKVGEFQDALQKGEYWKWNYLREHRELENVRHAFDDLTVDYSCTVNELKHKMSDGGKGNF